MSEDQTRLDPAERSARGVATALDATGMPLPEPTTLIEESWRDFIFAEVWTRPGLPRRARFLVAMASACTCGLTDTQIDGYVRGALKSGELSLSELREGALHLGVYSGWGNGGKLDRAITRVQDELGLEPIALESFRAPPWNTKSRTDKGYAEFTKTMTFPPGPPNTPATSPFGEAIENFVFGEMWWRPGLDEPSRRWITLVGVCESAAEVPIASHIHAAMASGNCKPEEMPEFVLQYGTHAGWPKASRIDGVVRQQVGHIRDGKDWMGR